MRTIVHAAIAPIAVLAFGFASLLPSHTAPASANPAASAAPVYLALGDSLAYGMQIGRLKQEIAKDSVHASTFDTGYVNDLAAALRASQPNLHVVDLGCPGETTSSFINGPCAYATNGKPFGTTPLPMHVRYAGSQLSTAVRFLKRDGKRVQLVTLDIGVNDLRAVELHCPAKTFNACLTANWPAALARTKANLATIVSRLRAAAPHARFLVMTYYNWLAPLDPASDREVSSLNRAIVAAASAQGMTSVDTFASFNRTGIEKQRICTLTLICGPTKDLHPTNAGYRLIASLFDQAYRL